MAFRETRLPSLRLALPPLLILLLAVAVFVAACGVEPQTTTQFDARPTPTPVDPTPTPRPTPTPVPTATPTQEPSSVPITGWPLGLSSTGNDLEALLSGEERSCLRDALGDRYAAFQSASLADPQGATASPEVRDCLTPRSAAGIALAMFSASAGGLSFDTRNCLATTFISNPEAARALSEDGPSGGEAVIDILQCLTPEEAAALTPDDEGPPPDVEGFQCLSAELEKLEGGTEALQAMMSGDPAGLTMEQSALIGVAVQACGIETDFVFPEPGSTGPPIEGDGSVDDGSSTEGSGGDGMSTEGSGGDGSSTDGMSTEGSGEDGSSTDGSGGDGSSGGSDGSSTP